MNKSNHFLRTLPLIAVAAIAIAIAPSVAADDDIIQDNLAGNSKYNALNEQRNQLQEQIATEDKKRNQVIEGVSAQQLEQINDRQDSICLELRSQLVSVELQISELSIGERTEQVIQYINGVKLPSATQTTDSVAPSSQAKNN